MLSDKLYEVIKDSIDSGAAAGANVLVMKDGREIGYAEYGYRDLENKKPMERDTIFRLYSQTKPITAAAVMMLAAKGKIDLSSWLSEYMPEFGNPLVWDNGELRPAKHPVLVRDLLNMTSGYAYPDDTTAGGRKSGEIFWQIDQNLYTEHPITTQQFAKMAATMPLNFDPESRFQYGISADILGALVERVAGVSFGEFLEKEFFIPLDMKDTAFYVPAEKADRLAKVYDYSENGLKEVVTNHLGLRYLRDKAPAFESGGAGLCSTLDDYSHFAEMLINRGVYRGKRIMPEAAVRFMTHGGLTETQKPYLSAGWDWMQGYTYGNLMRVCEDESQTELFAYKGEYGWDGWLGTFFSNEPSCGVSFLMGVQQIGIGRAGTMTRKLKNVIMSSL